jgi:hypothetical protein
MLVKLGVLGEGEILEVGGVSVDSATELPTSGDASVASGDEGEFRPSVLD